MCSYIHNHVSYTALADLNVSHDKVKGNNTEQGSFHGDEANGDLFRSDQRCSLICLAK